ncbi:multidrug efflux pump component MtrF [Vibrio astriarenae]|nr:multidrug efflux pump component MtrF [Vibrio sp. C7]
MSSSASIKDTNTQKKSLFTRFLDAVEYLGNLLPHPITLFAIFCLAILVSSGIAGYFEVSVMDPRPEGAPGRAADGMIPCC